MTQGREQGISRREFVRKAAYVAPAIVTLKAAPAYAKNGSAKFEDMNTSPTRDTQDKRDSGGKSDDLDNGEKAQTRDKERRRD